MWVPRTTPNLQNVAIIRFLLHDCHAAHILLQVLRFFGYFQEAVTESNIENHRVRRVVLLYYLADDTLQVTEPKQDNSGIPQVRLHCRSQMEARQFKSAGFCQHALQLHSGAQQQRAGTRAEPA
jgi:hypothetical protein